MRRQQRFLTTVLLVVVVFVIGVFVGSAWTGAEPSSVEGMLKQSELSAESFLVEQELFDTFDTDCDLAEKRLAVLSDGLWQLGKILTGPEAEDDLGPENYNFLKRKFHLMQARTYILYRQFTANCRVDTNVVLFYFRRGDEESTRQGTVLDSLVDDFNLKVFAVEHAYSKDLEFLEDYYEVSSTPFLVVNYEHVFPGFASADEIIAVLHG